MKESILSLLWLLFIGCSTLSPQTVEHLFQSEITGAWKIDKAISGTKNLPIKYKNRVLFVFNEDGGFDMVNPGTGETYLDDPDLDGATFSYRIEATQFTRKLIIVCNDGDESAGSVEFDIEFPLQGVARLSGLNMKTPIQRINLNAIFPDLKKTQFFLKKSS